MEALRVKRGREEGRKSEGMENRGQERGIRERKGKEGIQYERDTGRHYDFQ